MLIDNKDDCITILLKPSIPCAKLYDCAKPTLFNKVVVALSAEIP